MKQGAVNLRRYPAVTATESASVGNLAETNHRIRLTHKHILNYFLHINQLT